MSPKEINQLMVDLKTDRLGLISLLRTGFSKQECKKRKIPLDKEGLCTDSNKLFDAFVLEVQSWLDGKRIMKKHLKKLKGVRRVIRALEGVVLKENLYAFFTEHNYFLKASPSEMIGTEREQELINIIEAVKSGSFS